MFEQTGFVSFVLRLLSNPAKLYQTMAVVMIVTGFFVAICLQKWQAMYGRYAGTNRSWWMGPPVPARLAWFVQECPAVLVPLSLLLVLRVLDVNSRWVFPLGFNTNTLLMGLFLLHYSQRAFLFPLLIRGGKPTPFLIMMLAVVFCAYNGSMQYAALTSAHFDHNSRWTQLRIFAGCAVFFAGMWINIQADASLRNLRKSANDKSYKIPHGGMFDYVTAANYFGESIEWFGFALACWNLAALAFAIFTACNLGPRAVQHHAWYKQRFPNYPRNRTAYVPFLL